MSNLDDLLSMAEAGKLLGLSDRAVRMMCAAKQIKHVRLGPNGGRYKIKRRWVDEHLESRTVTPNDSVDVNATQSHELNGAALGSVVRVPKAPKKVTSVAAAARALRNEMAGK